MQTTRKVCALSFMPDMRLAYERILSEARDILHILEKRFLTFTQQQYMFIIALDRCREINFEPKAMVGSIAQVAHYAKNISNHHTDKRILKMFLILARDLGEFRRTLVKLTKQSDEKLENIFSKWKKVLEPNQNIINIRTKYPNTHLNHLSVDECRNHFGGIVSVLPIAMDCAREALKRIELTRVYRPNEAMQKCTQREELPKPRSPRPCMLKEMEKQVMMPSQKCKRAQPPSPNISSPVSSVYLPTPQKIPSVEAHLSLGQVQDCKINRLLQDTEKLRRDEQKWAQRRGERAAWEVGQDPKLAAMHINKCLWKDRTCSEEFVGRMLEDKRKRDKKYLQCKR